MENDSRAIRALLASGWRVATVWECALKGRTRPDFSEAMQHLVAWALLHNSVYWRDEAVIEFSVTRLAS